MLGRYSFRSSTPVDGGLRPPRVPGAGGLVVTDFAAPHVQVTVELYEQRGPLQVLADVVGGGELLVSQASRTRWCTVGSSCCTSGQA
ncbi:hypothetical protein ACWDYJ_13055 [Streptomyces sp. NPDC003042]